MDPIKTLDRRYEGLTWAASFLWLGVRGFLPGLPVGTGLLGVGLVLVGVNLARRLSKIPLKEVSTALGATALLTGSLALYLGRLGIRVELPFFSLLLVAIGVVFLVRSIEGRGGARPVTDGWAAPNARPARLSELKAQAA